MRHFANVFVIWCQKWYGICVYKSMDKCKKDGTVLLTHWNYVFLALTHRNRDKKKSFPPKSVQIAKLTYIQGPDMRCLTMFIYILLETSHVIKARTLGLVRAIWQWNTLDSCYMYWITPPALPVVKSCNTASCVSLSNLTHQMFLLQWNLSITTT